MKFDYAIGNPPYNNQQCDTSNLQTPVYHIFIEESYKIAKCTELITPTRFLFNTGLTPKNWNKKMLNDENFKVLEYEENADNIFPNTEIKGGVAIHIRDEDKVYGAIKEFIPYPELKSIKQEINIHDNHFLDEVMFSQGTYRLADEFFKDYPDANRRLKKDGNIINTNFFDKIPEANIKRVERESNNYLKVLYKPKNKEREIAYMKKEYIQTNDLIDTYNVAYPKATGNGKYGEKTAKSEIMKPGEITTKTFINFATFNTKYEAVALQKYLKTKFLRALLGIKKTTQHNPKEVWSNIPLQDFTENSDINWDVSIKEIDEQLYEKYDLTTTEIEFIETHVEKMT